jgi:hypothetical protein
MLINPRLGLERDNPRVKVGARSTLTGRRSTVGAGVPMSHCDEVCQFARVERANVAGITAAVER